MKITIGRVEGEVFGYKRSLLVDLEIRLNTEKRRKLDINLKRVNKTKDLAISGNVWNIKKTDIIMGGQINEEIREWLKKDRFKELYISKKKLLKILDIWDRWHLNDLHAGTKKQEEAVKEWRKKNKISGWAYEREVKYLKSIGLYEDRGYKYGKEWLYEPLPNEVIKFINNLKG